MKNIEISDKKKAIVVTTWDYLLKTGLSNASIGELCKETKLSQSSLYYWFENKYDIWISAGKYGMSVVVDNLIKYTFDHVGNIRTYFDTLLDEVEKYKHSLRLAIQITTSPIYGDFMRERAMSFRTLYEKYARELINIFGCTNEQAEIFVYSVIALVIDYAIWDDREKTQMLLENLYERIIEKIGVRQ